jgi:hypothetical protein
MNPREIQCLADAVKINSRWIIKMRCSASEQLHQDGLEERGIFNDAEELRDEMLEDTIEEQYSSSVEMNRRFHSSEDSSKESR